MDENSLSTSFEKNIHKLSVIVAVLIVLIVGVLAFSSLQKKKTPKDVSAIPNSAVFAQYKEVKSAVKPVLQSYTLKSADLVNLDAVSADAKMQFNPNELGSLETSGFFIKPVQPVLSDPNTPLEKGGNRSDDMVDLYEAIGGDTRAWERKPENAVFVTTDFLTHTYHILIDRTFQKTEEVYFQPALKKLTDTLYQDALNRYNKEQNPQLKESWKRLTVFYLVPKVILESSVNKPKDYFGSPEEQEKYLKEDEDADSSANVEAQLKKYQNTVPAEIYQLANEELGYVMKAEAFGVPSPLYGKLKPDAPEDYTQYTPRSHYTRNSTLRGYFRAMMWYGRHGFEVNNQALTQDAVLMTWQLKDNQIDGKPAADMWEYIYLPTIFFVGKSDDLTYYDYSDLLKNIYGDTVPYSAFSDQAKLEEFQNAAQKLQGPKILSEIKVFDPSEAPTKEDLLKSTKGFRFMGQRFIPDSYILASFTQGDEKPDSQTGQKLPSTPTALMVMTILGSKTADSLLNDWVTVNAPDSNKVIAKVKKQLEDEFNQFDEATWTQNIYWSWLYNLKPLLVDYNEGYPVFMRGLPWSKKSLLTALGSWTELRHDTLLYAKQSFAELGGGGEQPPPPPVPKGYVEPNLDFLTRLIALNNMTKDGLESRGLLVPGQKGKFESFGESLEFFKTIAEKELSDQVITDDEYEKLRTIITLKYPDIVWTPDGDQMTEEDARAGIIADVHTDAKKGQILYEATGMPSVLYVAVKDKNGARLTRGVTYSYYEFTRPVGSRLNDQDWQGMVYEGKNSGDFPSPPLWTETLVK